MQFFALTGTRKVLKWGTPGVARVLFAKSTKKRTQIEYSYETSPGVPFRGGGFVLRGQVLREGMPIVICYLPDRPERSVLVDCSIWKIELLGEPKTSA
ncbi:MAG: hypothetical protein WB997_10675 [Candidatus Acidiferrales bacterium]